MARTDGFLLLPVTLALVLVGALAYALTRDAGMNIAGVEAEYDAEAARYLAEGAFNLARWRNNQKKCNGVASFQATKLYRYSLKSSNIGTTPGDLVGTMTANDITEVKSNSGDKVKGYITVDVSSATTRTPAGAQRILRTVPRYDFDKDPVTTQVAGGASITIHSGAPPQDKVNYMELTDSGAANQSYGLLRFDLSTVPAKALVKEAKIELERDGGEPWFLPFRKLTLHRVTRPWDPATASWNSPDWSKPGGDYSLNGVDSHHMVEGLYVAYVVDDGIYTWHIDTLAAGWLDGTVPNYGVLFKPTNLNKSRFRTFASSVGQVPKLTLAYFPPCT